MTAWELVEYFGRLYGLPRDRLAERMDTIFGWLKMNDFRDVLGSKMSTGMKQKVSIARTIVHDPPVLIFDEPTSGLDVLVARAVLQKIIELRELGKTIVFSTHAMHEVAKLCSRVAIIHRGRLQAEGAPDDLLQRFDQPDLEELFFYLVERADSGAGETIPTTGDFEVRARGSYHEDTRTA
jgi:sodium transport system ATP-binding protein